MSGHNEVVVQRAHDGGADVPEETVIRIGPETFPEFDVKVWRASAWVLHRKNAVAIVNALVESLPGGTIDHLLTYLLERKVGYLTVPLPRPHAEKENDDGQ